ncbi:MAG: hypothetical protein ACYC46_05320 [Acidobacteriaceae bacterium]
MVIPYPRHIKLGHALLFAGVLWILEVAAGTTIYFSSCVFIYVLLATLAFNIVGGLHRPSGGYIFSIAVLGLIFSQCAKVAFFEPAQKNLLEPNVTITVYTAGMAGILVAAYLSRKLVPSRTILERIQGFKPRKSSFISPEEMNKIAIGCVALGVGMQMLLMVHGKFSQGTMWSALNQFGALLPLGLLLAVYATILKTGGRQSITWTFIVGAMFMFLVNGVIGASKQGLFTPFACWLIPCAALQFRLRAQSALLMAIAVIFTSYYFVPYVQATKSYGVEDFTLRADHAISLLSNPTQLREQYVSQQELERATRSYTDKGYYYYDASPLGLIDRFSLISMDDAMIALTDSKNETVGLFPILGGFEGLVPHFIWPSRTYIAWGNYYARELGVISENDVTTGISFSVMCDAYHIDKWIGVLLVLPAMMLLLFTVIDAIAADTTIAPWGLFYIIFFLHAAPESMFSFFPHIIFFMGGVLIVTVVVALYILPILASLVLPSSRSLSHAGTTLRGTVRRSHI